MFELFAFFTRIFVREAICPNLIVGTNNSFQQDHLKPPGAGYQLLCDLHPLIQNGASPSMYMTALLFTSRLVRRWA
jgi:hypothetical protein